MCKNQDVGASQLEKFLLQVFLKRGDSGSEGVEVLVAGKWIDNVISAVRHSTSLIMLLLLCGKSIINFVCMLLNQFSLLKKKIVSMNNCLF